MSATSTRASQAGTTRSARAATAPARPIGLDPDLAPHDNAWTDQHPSRTGRLRGLDGLRALAVLAVVGYHLAPGTIPGGFLGVDVFFVVSGFLITTLLLRDVATRGRLDLPRFWRRRARRLLPALVVVVVAAVLTARVVEPDLLVGIRRQVVGALTFSSNWVEITAGSSYFDQTQPVLFQTFWSLAIEEQFYLVWPVLLAVLLVVVRTSTRRAVVAAAGALVSAVAMAVLVVPGADPTRVYFGTGTHVCGLLLGVAAAFWWSSHPVLLGATRVRRRAVVAASLVLATLVLMLRSESVWTYRGGILLASACAVVLVAACADATTRAAAAATPAAAATRAGGGLTLLEAPPLVWIGERSYGLYLWHWPVILLVTAVVGAQVGTGAWWAATAVSLVLSGALTAASYRWVETPVRADGFRTTAARAGAAVAREGRGLRADGLLARCTRPRVVAGAVVLAVLGAAVVVVTAPRASQAELAVERGQAVLAAQEVSDRLRTAGGAAKLPTGGAVTGSQISAFGDSVLSGAAPAVLEAFPGIDIDAKPIRKWLDAPALVEQAERSGSLRDVVVLNFGTNGGFQFPGSKAAVTSVLHTIGPDRRVVLVNTVGVSYWVPAANAELARIAAGYPNVVVADWNGAVHAHAGLLHADRTHPNVQGTQVYAEVLARALAALPARAPASPTRVGG